MAFTSRIPNSHLCPMNIPMASVIVAAALRAMTFRLVVVPSILTIAVLMVTRWWDRKRVGGTGSYVLAPTHD